MQNMPEDDGSPTPFNWGHCSTQSVRDGLDIGIGEVVILNQNMRSCLANARGLKDCIHEILPNYISIQETWNHEVKIDGYKTITKHRPTRGGGVGIMYKISNKLITQESGTCQDIEFIIGSNKSVVIFNYYRPPRGCVKTFCETIS